MYLFVKSLTQICGTVAGKWFQSNLISTQISEVWCEMIPNLKAFFNVFMTHAAKTAFKSII